jgi:hypothetical protein
VTENAREKAFRIFAAPGISIGVAKSGEEDLDTDFVGLRRSDFDVFDC